MKKQSFYLSVLIGIICVCLLAYIALSREEMYYPQDGKVIVLEEENLLALAEGNVVRLIDTNNKITRTITLPLDQLPNEYMLCLFEQGIVVIDQSWQNILDDNDDIKLKNISLWNWQGEREDEFQDKTIISTPEFTQAFEPIVLKDGVGLNLDARPYWVDENYLLFNLEIGLFSLNLENYTIDNIYTVPYEPEDEDKTLGFRLLSNYNCQVCAEKFYYQLPKDDNGLGKIYRFAQGESSVLFGGQDFSGFYVNDEAIFPYVTDNSATEYYWSNTMQENLPLEQKLTLSKEEHDSTFLGKNFFVLFAWTMEEKKITIHVIDSRNGEKKSFVMEDLNAEDWFFMPEFYWAGAERDNYYFAFRLPPQNNEQKERFALFNGQGQFLQEIPATARQDAYSGILPYPHFLAINLGEDEQALWSVQQIE